MKEKDCKDLLDKLFNTLESPAAMTVLMWLLIFGSSYFLAHIIIAVIK